MTSLQLRTIFVPPHDDAASSSVLDLPYKPCGIMYEVHLPIGSDGRTGIDIRLDLLGRNFSATACAKKPRHVFHG
jgi:hypothetical protein